LKAVVHWFLEPAVVTRGRPLQETWLSGSRKGLVLILKGLLFHISVLKDGFVLFFSVFELHTKYFVYIFSMKILLFISRKFPCIIYLIIRFSNFGLKILLTVGEFLFFIAVLAGTHCGLYKGSYNTLNTLS
jgi:hypothetical protein